MRGSLADSARLDIVETDGSAWCMRCSQPVLIARRGDACPLCGSFQLQVTGGERMRVMDMEIQ
jgi:hydrogenase nickel incorporation protein HypA/HybF